MSSRTAMETCSHRAPPARRRGRGVPASVSILALPLLLSLSLAATDARAQSADSVAATAAVLDSGTAYADTAQATTTDPAAATAVTVTPPIPPSPPPPPPPRPRTLDALDEWLDYKSHAHVLSLPVEARVFYGRALRARRAGDAAEAVRLMRGAAQLDPSFLEPRLALVGWSLFRDPAESVGQAKSARELVQRDFSAQWTLLANGIMTLVQAWYLALLATACLVLMARHAEIRHGIQDRLTRWVSGPTASAWSWALVLAPFVTGFGIALPAVFFMAMGWPLFRWRERTLFVVLVLSLLALPWVGTQLTRLATPMRPQSSTLAALVALEAEGDVPTGRAAFLAHAAQHEDDPYVAFGRAWLAQQDGDLAAAEAGYERALAAWPDDDRVLNDLGQVRALQGRYPEAIEDFKHAFAVAPNNATACFNLSQAYTKTYDFQSATAAIARASQIDFDLVSRYKTQAGSAGSLPLIPQWLSARRMWRGVADVGTRVPAWPPAWRDRPETRGLRFVLFLALAVVLGLGLGALMAAGLPQHRCSNCGRVVCRRCSARRRSESLCRACSHAVAGAESPEFVRMLLGRQRQRTERMPRLARLVSSCLVPGLGLALHQSVFRPFWIALLASLGVGFVLGASPFAAHPRIASADSILPGLLALAAVAVSYALSIAGYLAASSRADALAAAAARAPRPVPTPRPRPDEAAPESEAA